MFGYHGSKEIKPDVILNSQEGFDVKHARSGGMYGPGLYFAKKSQYSLGGYAYYDR